MSAVTCPCCYEAYDEGSGSVARRLNGCGHVLCAACMQGNLFDNEFYCPECGDKCEGGSIDAFSSLYDPTNIDDGSASVDLALESLDLVLPEEDETPSSLMGRHSKRGSTSRIVSTCTAPGCTKKPVGMERYCLDHIGRRSESLAQAGAIASNLADTSLRRLTVDRAGLRLSESHENMDYDEAPELLASRFRQQERMDLGEAIALIEAAREVMAKEPNVLRLKAPFVVVGDIHGQFFDLLNLFKVGGAPGSQASYLFLGDYVDRGSFSCEVMLLLLALKVKFPERIWLLRGNHECGSVTGHFGFKEECKAKYGMPVYYNFLTMFQTMPLAAIIETAYGNIFACHGGLSPSLLDVEDIKKMNRIIEPESDKGLLDILWADPSNDESEVELAQQLGSRSDLDEHLKNLEVRWEHNSVRGCSYVFGYAATVAFLRKNNLVSIIRAHEVQEKGFSEHFQSESAPPLLARGSAEDGEEAAGGEGAEPSAVGFPKAAFPYESISLEVEKQKKEGSKSRIPFNTFEDNSKHLPLVVTVFSAPNYCGKYANKGAILLMGYELDEFQFVQYDCVPHPVPSTAENEMNNQIAAVLKACPYMPSTLGVFVDLALELGFVENLFEEEIPEMSKKESSKTPEATVASETPKPVNRGLNLPDPHALMKMSPENAQSPFGYWNRRRNSMPAMSSNASAAISMAAAPGKSSTPRRSSVAAMTPLAARKQIPLFLSPMSPMRPGGKSLLKPGAIDILKFAETLQEHQVHLPTHLNTAHPRPTTMVAEVHKSTASAHPLSSPIKPLNSDDISETVSTIKQLESVEYSDYDNGQRPWRPPLKKPVRVDSSSLMSQLFEATTTEDEENIRPAQPEPRRRASVGNAVEMNVLYNQAHVDDAVNEQHPDKLIEMIESLEKDTDEIFESVSGVDGSKDETVISDSQVAAEVVNTSPAESAAASEGEIGDEQSSQPEVFSRDELIALRLLFSIFDRWGRGFIEYDDLIAYGEETGDFSRIRDVNLAVEILDVDGDGRIGLLDFIHFAARLRTKPAANGYLQGFIN